MDLLASPSRADPGFLGPSHDWSRPTEAFGSISGSGFKAGIEPVAPPDPDHPPTNRSGRGALFRHLPEPLRPGSFRRGGRIRAAPSGMSGSLQRGHRRPLRFMTFGPIGRTGPTDGMTQRQGRTNASRATRTKRSGTK